MKKTSIVLGLMLIASCGVCQTTLIDSRQVRITTNDFPMMVSVGVTNLQDMVKWISLNMEVQAGSCTNDQTNVFSRAFTSVPKVTASWTDSTTNSFLYIKSVTPSNCVIGSTMSTNLTINWIAK